MPIEDAAQLALDRILKVATVEQVTATPEPEVLAQQVTPLPNINIPEAMVVTPETQGAPAPVTTPTAPVVAGFPPATQKGVAPLPPIILPPEFMIGGEEALAEAREVGRFTIPGRILRGVAARPEPLPTGVEPIKPVIVIPEGGTPYPLIGAAGETVNAVLMPDYTVWLDGTQIGLHNISADKFEPSEDLQADNLIPPGGTELILINSETGEEITAILKPDLSVELDGVVVGSYDFSTGTFTPTDAPPVPRTEEQLREQLASSMPTPERIQAEKELATIEQQKNVEIAVPALEALYPDKTLDEITKKIEGDVEAFLELIKEGGKTPENFAILHSLFPNITDEEIGQVFGDIPGLPEPLQNLLDDVPFLKGMFDAGLAGLQGVGEIFETIGLPIELNIAYRDVKGVEESDAEREFVERFEFDARGMPLPAPLKGEVPPAMRIILNPSDGLKDAYHAAFSTLDQIKFSALNPVWYLGAGVKGVGAISQSLKATAAAGGLKGVLAKGAIVGLAPAVEAGRLVGGAIKAPFKLAKLVVKTPIKIGAKVLKKAPTAAEKAAKAVPKVKVAPKPAPLIKAVDTPVKTVTGKQLVLDTEAAIKKITELFRGRQPAARVIEAGKKAELGVRAARLEEIARKAGVPGTVTPEQFLAESRAALTGKFVERKVFEALPEGAITKREKDLVLSYIANHPLFPATRSGDFNRMNVARVLFEDIVKGGVPTKGEFKLLEQVFGWDFTEAIARHGTAAKAWRVFMDVTGLPKALKATADLSYTLRQAIFAGVAHPKLWGKGFTAQVKSFFRRSSYDDSQLAIRAHPEFQAGRKLRLDFTEVGKGGAVAEEAFPTRLSDKIPIMKQSNRAAATISNKMRWDPFFQYKAKYGNLYPPDDPVWEGLVKILNAATGRGVVPRSLVPSFTLLNRLFFSPRFALTPFQMVYYPIRYIRNPLVRRFAMRSWMGFIGLNVSLLGLGHVAGLWKVELDPTSSNFGRVRIGNSRFDLWHGYLPWIRLISRIVEGTTKTQTGEVKEINKADMVVHTIRGKLDPIAAAAWDMLEGRSYIGEEFPPKEEDVPRALRDRLLPLSVNDVWDAYASEGVTGAFIAGTAAFLGANVATYPSSVFSNWADWVAEQTGKDWTNEELRALNPDYTEADGAWLESGFYDLSTARARNQFLKENPELNASMYFWGKRKQLLTPEAVTEFNKLLEKFDLAADIFPVREIEEPFDPEGKDQQLIFEELLSRVPSYYNDTIWDNQEEWLAKDLTGLITTLQEVWTVDRKLIDTYERDMIGKENDVREQFRIDNPETDATLALWDRVSRIQTTEAYETLKLKADEIGMPHDAVPALSRTETVDGVVVDRSWDYLDIYPSYFKQYIDENRKDFSKAQLETMTALLEVEQAKVTGIMDAYTELDNDDARLKARLSNATLDAALNLWGKLTTVKSTDAYNQLRDMAARTGIPQNVIAALNRTEKVDGLVVDRSYDYLDIYPGYFNKYIDANKSKFPDEQLVDITATLEGQKAKDQSAIDSYEDIEDAEQRAQARLDNPDLDATLNIWGKVGSVNSVDAFIALQKKAGEVGIPVESLPALNKRLKLFEDDVLPKADEQLLFYYINSVPTFIGQFAWDNRASFKNKDLQTILTTMQRHKESDTKLIEEYRKDTEGKSATWIAAYRRQNPEIEVALVAWAGFKTISSSRAERLLELRAKAWDIPVSLFDVKPA